MDGHLHSFSDTDLQCTFIPKRSSSIRFTAYMTTSASFGAPGQRRERSALINTSVSHAIEIEILEPPALKTPEKGNHRPPPEDHGPVLAQPFPVRPRPFLSPGSPAPSTPLRKRHHMVLRNQYPTPPATPDRFIPPRKSTESLAKIFWASKSPSQLSSAERTLRHAAASPDPFTSRKSSGSSPLKFNTKRDSPPFSIRSVSSRAAGTETAWHASPSSPTYRGPVRAVHDGHGRLLGSGTNAPIYSANFFPDETPGESGQRFESRIAMALDIDQTSRMFDIPQAFPSSNGTRAT